MFLQPKGTCSAVNVNFCKNCKNYGTEYHCKDCKQDMCASCKELHVFDLNTKNHHVTLYRNKYSYRTSYEHHVCVKHTKYVYDMYCEQCDTPICVQCTGHSSHKTTGFRAAYKNILKQHKNRIIEIRGETIYNLRVLQQNTTHDVNYVASTYHDGMVYLLIAFAAKSNTLKDCLDKVVETPGYSVLVRKYLKQKLLMEKNIIAIEQYEHRYEQSSNRPVQFLRFIKTCTDLQKNQAPILPKLCLKLPAETINTHDVIKILSEIEIRKKGKRRIVNEFLLKLTSIPLLTASNSVQHMKTCIVPDVEHCYHISCLSPNRVWVSDGKHLILADTTTGGTIFRVCNPLGYFNVGLHALNSTCDLFYIDKEFNINKLSSNMKTRSIFLKQPDSNWETQCLYCSLTSDELLVGMWKRGVGGKVLRYNSEGKMIQTIQSSDSCHTMYHDPHFITENINGDVVVSDFGRKNGAVIVTSSVGKYRFSYTGPPPSGSELDPRGICTDALSHILVCDLITNSVQMIDRNGTFILYLLTKRALGVNVPRSLSYDVNTHLLWAGSWYNNKVSVYRYINRKLQQPGKSYLHLHLC